MTLGRFDAEEDLWTSLPDCPYYNSAMVVTTAGLTTVGGYDGGPTNRLVSLTTVEGGFRKKQMWVGHFPRMPTSRYFLAAVCRGKTLIAAGGDAGGGRILSTVEILDMESLQWTPVCSLPHPMWWASITVGQEKIYLLGGLDQNGRTLSVYVCLLSDLLQTQPLDAQLKKTANQLTVWHQVANTPHYLSTAVCVGEVLAIGGKSAADEVTSAIVSYDPTSDSWEDMGHMTTPRPYPLVALLPSNKLIVAGDNSGETEIGKIVA